MNSLAADVREQSAVARYLRAHRTYLCDECLAMRLELPRRQVTMTTLGLRQVVGFQTVEDACSSCRRRRRVVRAC